MFEMSFNLMFDLLVPFGGFLFPLFLRFIYIYIYIYICIYIYMYTYMDRFGEFGQK